LETQLEELRTNVEQEKEKVNEKMQKVAYLEKELEGSKNDAYDLIFQKD
jgi:hypothetical protein